MRVICLRIANVPGPSDNEETTSYRPTRSRLDKTALFCAKSSFKELEIMTSIRKSAESLLSLVATSPDPDALDAILSQHWDCFDMETCGICDFIDEELEKK